MTENMVHNAAMLEMQNIVDGNVQLRGGWISLKEGSTLCIAAHWLGEERWVQHTVHYDNIQEGGVAVL